MKKRIKEWLSYSFYDILTYPREKKRIQKRNKIAKLIFQNYFEKNDLKKLHVGCGSHILPGWLNTDLSWNEDIAYLDAGKKFLFKEESFHYIFSEHLFEHLNFEEQINFLSESLRVLKKGGKLRIATPDLMFLINLYLSKGNSSYQDYFTYYFKNSGNLRKIKYKLGNIENPKPYIINNFFYSWGHKLIHDKSSLSELGLESGFNNVKYFTPGKSETPTFKNIERHGEIIGKERNELETMVLEFTK